MDLWYDMCHVKFKLGECLNDTLSHFIIHDEEQYPLLVKYSSMTRIQIIITKIPEVRYKNMTQLIKDSL
jgi:hypothetical protein